MAMILLMEGPWGTHTGLGRTVGHLIVLIAGVRKPSGVGLRKLVGRWRVREVAEPSVPQSVGLQSGAKKPSKTSGPEKLKIFFRGVT
jgi:hypothetical protein